MVIQMDNLPGYVREDVLPVEAVYPRGLREEATLAVEDSVPRVEQDVPPGVDHRQLTVRYPHDRVDVLDSVG